ncbi:MAG: FtsH protease activity modulator HflK [Candidatus Peribacteria bacterium]|jgi:membrane protease subunit HflK|nr:FtsH protease activity modulator HflK [Candidatus Peribacteria bacterium]
MEKNLKSLLNFLGVKFEEGEGWEFESYRFLPLNLIIVGFALYILGGLVFDSWFMLDKTERAAVETFGKFSYETEKAGGIHGKIPFIQTVRKVPTEVRHRWELGFRTKGENDYEVVEEESTMLARGEQVGSFEWIFQYTITRPYSWLYTIKNPEKILDKVSQGTMRLVVGKTYLDDVLTSQKYEVQESNRDLFQKYCKLIGLDVEINEVQLQDCDLPNEKVKAAYNEIVNAENRRNGQKDKANGYALSVILEAEGDSSAIINDAKSYESKMVNGAKGELERFEGLLEEFRKDPVTTENKLLYEAKQEVLSKSAKKTVIESKNTLNIKNFDAK